MARYKYLGNFVDNQFQGSAKSSKEVIARSPADLDDVLAEISFNSESVDGVVESSAVAQKKWSAESSSTRINHIVKLRDILGRNSKILSEIISRETGKPIWESSSEVQAAINKIDITISHGLKLVEEARIENAIPGVGGRLKFKPKGVLIVIGPFNFPLHLPHGHIVPALLTGNTVIFKPSELTPLTAQFYAQCILEAGIPAGVFSLVQGDGETGKKLVSHPKIDGVLFTGSYENGLRIKNATIADYWKILALEMGGKNAAIVWEDADLPKALYECLVGAYSTAGQRCSCTSRLILHRKIAPSFLEKFKIYAERLTIGHWSRDVFMGPLINPKSFDAYLEFQKVSELEGNQILLRGQPVDGGSRGYFVSPSIHVVSKSTRLSEYQSCEIFGPNVAVYLVDSLEEALELNNSLDFGLTTSFFSKNRDLFEIVVDQANTGQINWNRSTVGASSKLPFGGTKKSGNDRPSALFAVYYTTVPTSILEDNTPLSTSKLLPGINLDRFFAHVRSSRLEF